MLHPNEVRFDSAKATLLLSVHKGDVRDDIERLRSEATRLGLQEKKELHMTAIGFGTGKLLQAHLSSLDKSARGYLEEELRDLIRETVWDFSVEGQKVFSVRKEYSDFKDSQKKEIRESIVQMAEAPGLAFFYERLNQLFDASFEVPPAHITLFVGGSDLEKSLMGIGIDSQAAFEALHPTELLS